MNEKELKALKKLNKIAKRNEKRMRKGALKSVAYLKKINLLLNC